MKWILILTQFLLWKSEIFANPLPVYPAEVVARDLISSLDFFKEFGHVGVTTAPKQHPIFGKMPFKLLKF